MITKGLWRVMRSMWYYSHSESIHNGLASIRHQGICSHHDNIDLSILLMSNGVDACTIHPKISASGSRYVVFCCGLAPVNFAHIFKVTSLILGLSYSFGTGAAVRVIICSVPVGQPWRIWTNSFCCLLNSIELITTTLLWYHCHEQSYSETKFSSNVNYDGKAVSRPRWNVYNELTVHT